MRQRARLAGLLYLFTIVIGMVGAFADSRVVQDGASLAATACYVLVTLLLYTIFKPVNAPVSAVATLFSLVGCCLGILEALHKNGTHVNSLVFFGVYCLLLGYLIYSSRLMPRWLGILVCISGVGWLTFLSEGLARRLSYAPMVTGMLGEGALTLWLLIVGVSAHDASERAAVTDNRLPG